MGGCLSGKSGSRFCMHLVCIALLCKRNTRQALHHSQKGHRTTNAFPAGVCLTRVAQQHRMFYIYIYPLLFFFLSRSFFKSAAVILFLGSASLAIAICLLEYFLFCMYLSVSPAQCNTSLVSICIFFLVTNAPWLVTRKCPLQRIYL